MPDIVRGGLNREPEPAQHPWPDDCYLQGGATGVVLSKTGSYRTAFVEAFPKTPDVFIRGEGGTVAEAENDAWAKYQRMTQCPAHPEHGPWDRRAHRNGYAWCEQCGTGFGPQTTGLDELPSDPAEPPNALERALLGDPSDIIKQMADTLDIEKTGDVLTDAVNVAREISHPRQVNPDDNQ